MIESLALDAFLVLIILLLVPIGMYRGGLREVCSAAGLMLAYMVAVAWSDRWGTWLANRVDIDDGVARFSIAVLVLVVVTGLVGYGAAAAFSYHPGPGGRLYGGLIALFSALLFLAAMIQFVREDLHDGELPALIRNSYLGRTLATGFDNVLLAVTLGAMVATVFGMLVRERSTDDLVPVQAAPPVPVRRPVPAPALAAEPDRIDPVPSSLAEEPTATLRIREVRHWEDQAPPTEADLRSGWTETWPANDRATPISGRGRTAQTRAGTPPPRQGPERDEDVLRTWLEEEQRRNSGQSPRGHRSDE
ncbi:MAG TPA: CvpA family protein [Thermomicrobiales bacterium]|nr:CvpA family protein [Thermomicrobiales bacterium]